MPGTPGPTSDCACCNSDTPIDTPCNPTAVPRDLTLTFTYICSQISVNLHYDPDVAHGWTYGGAGDIAICGVFAFRDFTLQCVGTTWTAEFVYTESGIQQSATTGGGGLDAITVVSTNPLCLTTVGLGFAFSGCGSGGLYFAIGPGCDVVPPCCNDSGLSPTATLTYTITGMASATLNLTKTSDDPRYHGTFTCNVGDGHTQIRITYDSDCFCDSSIWQATFLVERLVDGVQTSANVWNGASFVAIGDVRADFSVSCSPYHLHYEGAGAITGTALTQSCGGKTYDFTTNNLGVVLDVVTP